MAGPTIRHAREYDQFVIVQRVNDSLRQVDVTEMHWNPQSARPNVDPPVSWTGQPDTLV